MCLHLTPFPPLPIDQLTSRVTRWSGGVVWAAARTSCTRSWREVASPSLLTQTSINVCKTRWVDVQGYEVDAASHSLVPIL